MAEFPFDRLYRQLMVWVSLAKYLRIPIAPDLMECDLYNGKS